MARSLIPPPSTSLPSARRMSSNMGRRRKSGISPTRARTCTMSCSLAASILRQIFRFYVLGRDGIPDASQPSGPAPADHALHSARGQGHCDRPHRFAQRRDGQCRGADGQHSRRLLFPTGPRLWAAAHAVEYHHPGPRRHGSRRHALAHDRGTDQSIAQPRRGWPRAGSGRWRSLRRIDATYVLAEPPNPTPGLLPPEPAQFSLYRLADAHGRLIPRDPPMLTRIMSRRSRILPRASRSAGSSRTPTPSGIRSISTNATSSWTGSRSIQDYVHPEGNQQPPQDNDGNPFYAIDEPPPAGSGKTVGQPFYSGEVDTVTIPNGLQVWLSLPMNEGPQIAGEFVMHCHILEHEDGGMMANVVAGPGRRGGFNDPYEDDAGPNIPHLAPAEVAAVKLQAAGPAQGFLGARPHLRYLPAE